MLYSNALSNALSSEQYDPMFGMLVAKLIFEFIVFQHCFNDCFEPNEYVGCAGAEFHECSQLIVFVLLQLWLLSNGRGRLDSTMRIPSPTLVSGIGSYSALHVLVNYLRFVFYFVLAREITLTNYIDSVLVARCGTISCHRTLPIVGMDNMRFYSGFVSVGLAVSGVWCIAHFFVDANGSCSMKI